MAARRLAGRQSAQELCDMTVFRPFSGRKSGSCLPNSFCQNDPDTTAGSGDSLLNTLILHHPRIDALPSPSLIVVGDVIKARSTSAMDSFRQDQEWRTTVPGFVDARTVARLWSKLEDAGKADDLRKAAGL